MNHGMKWGRKIRAPIITAVTAPTSTAPAITSFTTPTVGCTRGWKISKVYSRAVLVSSKSNTRHITSTKKIRSKELKGRTNISIPTAKAQKTWIWKFFSWRKTVLSPRKAKMRLRKRLRIHVLGYCKILSTTAFTRSPLAEPFAAPMATPIAFPISFFSVRPALLRASVTAACKLASSISAGR